MITTVKSYAELCLEIQKLREEKNELKEENESMKVWIAYLEARLMKLGTR
jgi:hypothetical protein